MNKSELLQTISSSTAFTQPADRALATQSLSTSEAESKLSAFVAERDKLQKLLAQRKLNAIQFQTIWACILIAIMVSIVFVLATEFQKFTVVMVASAAMTFMLLQQRNDLKIIETKEKLATAERNVWLMTTAAKAGLCQMAQDCVDTGGPITGQWRDIALTERSELLVLDCQIMADIQRAEVDAREAALRAAREAVAFERLHGRALATA